MLHKMTPTRLASIATNQATFVEFALFQRFFSNFLSPQVLVRLGLLLIISNSSYFFFPSGWTSSGKVIRLERQGNEKDARRRR